MHTRPLFRLICISLCLGLSLSGCNKPHASASATSLSSSPANANTNDAANRIADHARQNLEKAKSIEKELEKIDAERRKAIDEISQ